MDQETSNKVFEEYIEPYVLKRVKQAEQDGYERGVKEARSHYYERVRREADQEMLKRVLELEQTQSSRHDWSILVEDIKSLLSPTSSEKAEEVNNKE